MVGESTDQPHSLPHLAPLGCNHRIPSNQGYPSRLGKAWPQKHNDTIVCTHLVNFEGDEYHTTTSKSLEKDEELLKAGFVYVTERGGIKIYRKRK